MTEPVDWCKHEIMAVSCAECRPRTPPDRPTDGVLIERFRTAQYDGTCALERAHRIAAGTEIGLAVPDEGGEAFGWCCTACVQAITQGDQ